MHMMIVVLWHNKLPFSYCLFSESTTL